MAETVVSSKQENVKGQVINMKALGINKKIDELGRIVIPKDVRKALGVENSDYLQFFIDGDSLILKKLGNGCEFCGSESALFEFKGKFICSECKKALSEC